MTPSTILNRTDNLLSSARMTLRRKELIYRSRGTIPHFRLGRTYSTSTVLFSCLPQERARHMKSGINAADCARTARPPFCVLQTVSIKMASTILRATPPHRPLGSVSNFSVSVPNAPGPQEAAIRPAWSGTCRFPSQPYGDHTLPPRLSRGEEPLGKSQRKTCRF